MRRVVMRVPSEILEQLPGVAQRLHEETGLEHSAAAVVRGLLSIALDVIAGREHLAPSFVRARVKRGAKPGERRRRRRAPDVSLDQGAELPAAPPVR